MTRNPKPDPVPIAVVDIADAELALFPRDVVPVSADVLAAYAHHTARFPATTFTAQCLELHARSVAKWPDFAAALRSPECLEDVATAAELLASRQAREPRAFAAAEVERYKRGIASQLDVDGHPLADAAHAFLAAAARADAARAAEIAAAEHARVVAEQTAAAERARRRAEHDRIAAERDAAAREAESAEGVLKAVRENHRQMRVRWFVAALEASKLPSLKVKDGKSRGSYHTTDLIAAAPQMSIEQLNAFEAALARELERIEASEAQ